jgi:hypothetical protein
MPKGVQREDGTWDNPPTGVPEEIVEWRAADNGARVKADWWKHAFRTDKDPARQICGAKLRRGSDDRNVYFADGEERRRRCSYSINLFPNGRCWRHGGDSPGAAVVHGRYMQGVRGPLGRAQKRAEDDRQMLDLRPAIGLFDERMAQLSERIEAEGDTPNFRSFALRLFREMVQAEKDGDADMAKHYRKELRILLETGVRGDRQWTEILNVAERRAKRAERANLVLIKGHEVVSKTELTWVLARMLDLIRAEASGKAAARIQSRFAREVLGRLDPTSGGSRTLEAGSSLPGLPGEGDGVPAGRTGGEALEVSANGDRAALLAREVQCEDVPRSREDAGGGVDRADLPDDEGGLDRHQHGPDRPSGEEPPVGGDREDAREGEGGTPW